MMRKLLVLCSAVAILIAMGFAAYGYWQYLNTPFFKTRGLVHNSGNLHPAKFGLIHGFSLMLPCSPPVCK